MHWSNIFKMLDQFDFDIAPAVIAPLDFDGTFGAAGKSTGMSHSLKVARDDQITHQASGIRIPGPTVERLCSSSWARTS